MPKGKVRDFKGKSLIDWPRDYVVVDIETTGLDSDIDNIIEIGAVKVVDGTVTDRFSELINPDCSISPFVVQLTGITNAMVRDARKTLPVLEDFRSFLGDDIIVGHNVNFDVNFLYDACERHCLAPLSNNFVDTLRIAKKLLPELDHHRLQDLAIYYNVSYEGAHRAVVDCDITNECLIGMHGDMLERYGSVEVFAKAKNKKNT